MDSMELAIANQMKVILATIALLIARDNATGTVHASQAGVNAIARTVALHAQIESVQYATTVEHARLQIGLANAPRGGGATVAVNVLV